MLLCNRFSFVLIWMAILFPNLAYSDESNVEPNTQPKMCWVNIQNQANNQAHLPCEWANQYAITWEGEQWAINKNSSVIDGQGYITLHRKDGFQSVKYHSTWQKGNLDSEFNLDFGKFFRCVDDQCEQVDFQVDSKTIYRGSITFSSDKTDFVFSGNGRISSSNLIFDGDISKGMADGLGKICIAPQGTNLPKLPDDFDENDCNLPNLYADGFWESTSFVNGYIRQLYQNGVVYEGGFSDGLVENWGTTRWPDGSAYSGDLGGGKRNGQGNYHYSDGSIYQGEWKDGIKSGTGSLWIKPKQIHYDGEWNHGKFHGDGILEFANKSMLIGSFFQGKPNGECLFLDANKHTFQTVWKNGSLIFFRPTQDPKTNISFNFIPIPSAYADGFFSSAYESVKSGLVLSVNAAVSFVNEVIEHPEYIYNAAKGCLAGGSAAAISGAAGGAIVGGTILGAAGAVVASAPAAIVGVVAGGIAGGVIEGISGCLTQGTKAYMKKKYQGKDYTWNDAKKSFDEEFNLAHSKYGMMEGGLVAFAELAPVLGELAIKTTLVYRAIKIWEKLRKTIEVAANAASKNARIMARAKQMRKVRQAYNESLRKVGKAKNSINNLVNKFYKKSPTQHRNELKQSMKKQGVGNNKAKGKGNYNKPCKSNFEAHHIIPVGVVEKALSRGMLKCNGLINKGSSSYVNNAINGICISNIKKDKYHSRVRHKGSHNDYDSQVKILINGKSCKKIDKIQQCISKVLNLKTTLLSVNQVDLSRCASSTSQKELLKKITKNARGRTNGALVTKAAPTAAGRGSVSATAGNMARAAGITAASRRGVYHWILHSSTIKQPFVP